MSIEQDMRKGSIWSQVEDLQRRMAEIERAAHLALFDGETLAPPGDMDVAAGYGYRVNGEPLLGIDAAFLGLPGLRGFWPMTSVGGTALAYDMSGQGRTLTFNGNPEYGHADGVGYIDFDGTGDYLSLADASGLDITGTETYVASACRGLTIGGWFAPDSASASDMYMSKYNSVGSDQRSYLLWQSSGRPYFSISLDGTVGTRIDATAPDAVTTDQWQFIVGRFIPSTELSIHVNGVKTSLTSGVHASIHSGTAPLEIGSYNAGVGGPYDGKASRLFLEVMALDDDYLNALFQQTRRTYGV